LEQAAAKKDWETVQRHLLDASNALRALNGMGAAAPTLASFQQPAKVESLRADLKSAEKTLGEAQDAVLVKDSEHLQAAINKFRLIYKPIQEAAKQGQQ
jgi:hypothetical protein